MLDIGVSLLVRRRWGQARRAAAAARAAVGEGVGHQQVQQVGDEADHRDGPPVRHPGRAEHAEHALDVLAVAVAGQDGAGLAHLFERVLRADDDLDARGVERLREQLAEHLAALQHLDQRHGLLAQGELGLAQDVAEPFVVDVVERLLVGVLQDPRHRQRGLALHAVKGRGQQHHLVGRLLVQQGGQQVADPVQLVTVARAFQVEHLLADAAGVEQHGDQRDGVLDPDQGDPADPGSRGRERRDDGGRLHGVRQHGRRQVRPAVHVRLNLVELVADHPLLAGRRAVALHQVLHEEAVADVGGHASGRGVRVGDQAKLLQLGQLVPDGGRADARLVPPHDDLRGDRRGRPHVLLDHVFEHAPPSGRDLHAPRSVPPRPGRPPGRPRRISTRPLRVLTRFRTLAIAPPSGPCQYDPSAAPFACEHALTAPSRSISWPPR